MAVDVNMTIGNVSVTAHTDCSYSPDVYDDMLLRASVAAFQNWSRVQEQNPGLGISTLNEAQRFIDELRNGVGD